MEEELWCRIEAEAGQVRRVHLMHPNGEILASFPADHFSPELVRRMWSGHVLASLSDAGHDGSRLLSLKDQSGHVVFSERVSPDHLS